MLEPSSLEVTASRTLAFNVLVAYQKCINSERVKTIESISGLIERVTFFSEESGFAVLRVKVKGRHDLVTVVGSVASVSAGEWLTAEGEWVRDKEHGFQL